MFTAIPWQYNRVFQPRRARLWDASIRLMAGLRTPTTVMTTRLQTDGEAHGQ